MRFSLIILLTMISSVSLAQENSANSQQPKHSATQCFSEISRHMEEASAYANKFAIALSNIDILQEKIKTYETEIEKLQKENESLKNPVKK